MYFALLVLFLLVCLALIGVVLMQSGKGGGLAGGAFGGTAQTVFGGRGATDFLTRATMVLGGAFFLMAILLALLTPGRGRSTRSLLQEEARRSQTAAPRMPAAPGATPTSPAPVAPAPATPAPSTPAPVTPSGGGR